MAQKCMGIVIGTTQLKAVELSGSFGEVSLERYQMVDLPASFRDTVFGFQAAPEQGLEVPAAFKELAAEESEASVSIPGELCFYREIEFPFTDLKKIAQVIRLEAEGYFPFAMDEYLLEYLPPLSQNHSSQVLAFALGRTQFSQVLASLNTLGLDPAFSGIEGMTLPLLSVNSPPLARLWLDLGAQRIILVGAFGALPFLYRRISLGLDALTERLMKELSLSREAAEQLIAGADLSAEPEAGDSKSRIIAEWVNTVLGKVNETLHWYERNRKEGHPAAKFEEAILSGNGALLKGVEKYFERDLSIPGRKFTMPQWIKLTSEVPPETALLLAEPLSLALARMRKEGKKLVNFRKGEFAWKTEYQIPYQRLVMPAILLVLILVMGAAKGYGQYSLSKQRSAEIKMQILQEYQQLFPASAATDPVRQLPQALAVAEQKLEVYKDILYPSAVSALSAVADQMPEGAASILTRYNYSGNKIRIEGESADFTSSKEIVDRLSKVEFFKKVTLEDSRSNTAGKVNFSISIELKAAGEKNE